MKTLLEYTLPRPQPATGGRRKDSEPEVWLVHTIIGDGIQTNAAAAKMLWAISGTGAFNAVRYFLLVGKCGTHQFALTAKNGVIGRAAGVAAEAAGEGTEYEGVTSNAVRIFKYLVPEYYEDFKISIQAWVELHVEIVEPEAIHQPQAVAAPLSHAARLQRPGK